MPLFEFLDDHQRLEGRLAMAVEYDGTHYCGWQRLKQAPSVQAALETALGRVAAATVQVHCSGRTDSGVHATRQIVHFDAPTPRSTKAWVYGANANLPRDIAVRWVAPVADDFHARFLALARRYRYVILNQPSRPVLERANATWCREPLNAERMHEAAQALVGEHDFSSFPSGWLPVEVGDATRAFHRGQTLRHAGGHRYPGQCLSASHDSQHRRRTGRGRAR